MGSTGRKTLKKEFMKICFFGVDEVYVFFVVVCFAWSFYFFVCVLV